MNRANKYIGRKIPIRYIAIRASGTLTTTSITFANRQMVFIGAALDAVICQAAWFSNPANLDSHRRNSIVSTENTIMIAKHP